MAASLIGADPELPRGARPVLPGPPPYGPELLRALGSVPASPPPYCHAVTESLSLPAPTAAEHTSVFVLAAPPHAAIHLGAHGKLGGEALDRVAGFWRAIGLRPPQDADHLGALLMLYAELAEAETGARREPTRDRLRHAREALLFEHLWSWAPGYLTAVTGLGVPSLAAWAQLTLSALGREARRAAPPSALPLALRTAPPPVTPADGRGQLLDALVAPVCSAVLLTGTDLREATAAAGLGYRVGERRYTLQSMLDQDPEATLGWLAGHARRWAALHAAQQPVAGHDPRHWWARRAARSARTLRQLKAGLTAPAT
jgi:TorA maturation chaperone TorD